MSLQKAESTIEVAAVCDVFNHRRTETARRVEEQVGKRPFETGDYRDILADKSIDAVCIATPDHWHAKQTVDALTEGKHVYCEKPMTHTVEEAISVLRAWRESGLVMQVGVQSTSLPVWKSVNQWITSGRLGKVLQYQTEYFRNSNVGQWRYYKLTPDMTPSNIDWKMFLGTEFGLAPEMEFDRALFGQWRCYWPFGSGMFTDLFVHRTTSMLLATGLRFPGRVVGAGGIFLEYDGRQVPDVAIVVADFPEGVQGLVTATMCASATPLKQTIRGHNGSIVLGTGEKFSGFDFVAERPQVTLDSSIRNERVDIHDPGKSHFENFVDAARAGKPELVNCSPELGAAALIIVKLGSQSYREGKVFHFDAERLSATNADANWASDWEQRSTTRLPALHVPGWRGGDTGSVLQPPTYQQLAGPWKNGADPAESVLEHFKK